MTGKEDLIEIVKIKNNVVDAVEYEKMKAMKLEIELSKYKRAFEILKDKLEIKVRGECPDIDYYGEPIIGNMDFTLNDEIPLTYEEYELLEELMKGETENRN